MPKKKSSTKTKKKTVTRPRSKSQSRKKKDKKPKKTTTRRNSDISVIRTTVKTIHRDYDAKRREEAKAMAERRRSLNASRKGIFHCFV